MDTEPKLTPKQQAFVAEYLIDLNATQAAIRAGYSAKTAQEQSSRLLSNVIVQQAIQAGMDKRKERVEVTADYVLRTIIETVERCKQAEPVMIRGPGGEMIESGEYKFDSNAVLKGAELIGRHLKLFTDKVETTGKDGSPIKTETTVTMAGQMSSAILKRLGSGD